MTYHRVSPTPPETTLILRDGWIEFHSPWPDEFFVEDLHAAVQASERWFDYETNTWHVAERHLDTMKRLVEEAFSKPEVQC